MLRSLATAESAAATARTWLTPPAAAVHLGGGEGLDGVDDQQPGPHLVDVTEHRGQVVLGGQVDVGVQRAHPVRPSRTWAADSSPLTIRTGPWPLARPCLGRGQQQGRLAHPGSPASRTTAPGSDRRPAPGRVRPGRWPAG